MHQLLNGVYYVTWHHTNAWKKSSEQETFCNGDLFQLQWQSNEISRAVQLDAAAQRMLVIPVTGQSGKLLRYFSLRDRCHISCNVKHEAFCYGDNTSLWLQHSPQPLQSQISLAALHRYTCSLAPCLLLNFPANITLEIPYLQGHISWVQKKS